MHCSLHGRVAHIADLLSLQLPRDYSTRAASFFPHFSLHSPLHTLRSFLGRPARLASSSERDPFSFAIQRFTTWWSNPVLRQISAVVRPCLCQVITAPRSSGGRRDMRFFRKKSKKSSTYHGTKSCVLYVVCAVYFDRLPRIWKVEGAGSKALNYSIPYPARSLNHHRKKIVTTYVPLFMCIKIYIIYM